MNWELTIELFCAVGIVWMSFAMPFSRGWRPLNQRMEDCIRQTVLALERPIA